MSGASIAISQYVRLAVRVIVLAGAVLAILVLAPGKARADIGDMTGGVLTGAVEGVGGAVEDVGGAVDTAVDTAGTALEATEPTVDETVGGVLDTVGDVTDDATEAVGDASQAVTGVVDQVTDELPAVTDVVTGTVEEVVTGTVEEVVTGTMEVVTGTVEDVTARWTSGPSTDRSEPCWTMWSRRSANSPPGRRRGSSPRDPAPPRNLRRSILPPRRLTLTGRPCPAAPPVSLFRPSTPGPGRPTSRRLRRSPCLGRGTARRSAVA